MVMVEYSLHDGRNKTFLLSRLALRASTARRAAWRGRGQRQRRSPARVGVVTWSVWSSSSIEDTFSSQFSAIEHS